ncbi:hypothetical protein K2173_007328 [Erythroxylum novogranatense]|uniref:Glycosyltransferase n=1 Tax=Erythroxylum novogranatense TaxID=1862640 RepID=A0AAV8T799_9ROSI|nr:hypothetical protein K2173_007328 [Erythroxylum novogranatense]
MDVTKTEKPHIAVLASPGLGHVIPLFELAKRLVIDHDCRVSFLAITTNEASAAQDQILRSPTIPYDLDVVNLPFVDVFAVAAPDITVVARLCVIVEESLKSLKSVLIELGKPTAVVIDLFCTQAFDVCSELSIPAYSFFTASTALLTYCLCLPTYDREVEGEYVDLPEPVKVPGCSEIRTEDLLDQVKNRKIDEYKWFFFHVSRLPMASGIFMNTWDDLEPICIKAIKENAFYKQIPTPQVFPVGPLIKQDEPLSDRDVEILSWLDKQPPESVLFISLGSGGTLTMEQLSELAWGLELSQQRFVFVVRNPTQSSASASFFNVGSDVNDPKAYLPEGFSERTRERGLVVPSWASQVAVLKHASTGGFLSHCGWNSTLESLSHAVPMICWPLYAEQRMNATILAEQVGVAIKPKVDSEQTVVGREEIKRVVKLLMEGDEGKIMRQKARKLKESAAKTLKIGGSSYNSFARVVNEWKTWIPGSDSFEDMFK